MVRRGGGPDNSARLARLPKVSNTFTDRIDGNVKSSRDHRSVRALVVSAIPQLAQAEGWVENLFGGDKELFLRFLQRHSENQAWTDGYGIMCQVGDV